MSTCLRAPRILARTLCQELRRANYSRTDILLLVNELLDQVSNDIRSTPSGQTSTADLVVDEHTGLHGAEVLSNILEFELRQTGKGPPRGAVMVLCFDVELPGTCPPEVQREFHRRIADVLRGAKRRHDSLGLLHTRRYLLILTQVDAENVRAIERRYCSELEEKLESCVWEPRIAIRCAISHGQGSSPEQLIGECLESAIRYVGRSPASGEIGPSERDGARTAA
jgi:hypothetical protein